MLTYAYSNLQTISNTFCFNIFIVLKMNKKIQASIGITRAGAKSLLIITKSKSIIMSIKIKTFWNMGMLIKH